MLEQSPSLPSQCISCLQEGLETSGLYEQWEDCVCEDNSFPLPTQEK